MNTDRRTLLGAAAAAAAIPAVAAAPASAQSAPAAGQTPGAVRFKVGDLTVTALHDGTIQGKLNDGWVRNATTAQIQAELAANFLPTETINNNFTAFLVNTGSRLVLLDTGFRDNGAPGTGRIAGGLAAIGIEPKQINTVIISHFHGDHINGLRLKDGTAVYPNAEIMVPEGEWAFWMDDARMNATPENMRGNFVNARRVFGPIANDVKRYAYGQELMTGITAVDARGHTPGHAAIALTSGSGRFLYMADATNNPILFARNPEWQLMFDMDGATAITTRRRLLDMASSERMQLGFYHAFFPATGFVAKDGGGYRYVPAPYSSLV